VHRSRAERLEDEQVERAVQQVVALHRVSTSQDRLGTSGSIDPMSLDSQGIRSIEVDGAMREVIGVMPNGFDLMDQHVELWLPLQLPPTLRQFRASHFLSLIGRLKDGVTAAEAEAEPASLIANW